jgi:NADPH-dependent curcumin reductase CurA
MAVAEPNKSLILAHYAQGLPIPGRDLIVDSRPLDITIPPPNGLILTILYASLDPYQRGRMRAPTPGYASIPYPLNEPITNAVVGRVLKSNSPDYGEGELVVSSATPIAEYATITSDALERVVKIENPHNLELGHFLGALGMPGLAAWSSLYAIGKPKAGETLFVSSAAGAVGMIVGQVAKKEGLRVIGSVGSDEKLKFITEDLGFDGGFNYQKENASEALTRLAPEGLDIYFDNVGGEQLDAALVAMKRFGRIVACGSVSLPVLLPSFDCSVISSSHTN